jgi:hypothetical protein
MLLYLILVYGPSIVCAIHAARTGRPFFWLFIVIIAPGLGPAIYFFVEWLPELLGGRTANRLARRARETVDPDRAYREAKSALADVPSVQNQLKFADVCMDTGRFAEAEQAYRAGLVGLHADDPTLLHGSARALVELDRPAEALERLHALQAQGAAQSPAVQLTLARTLDALDQRPEAEAAYRFAADRAAGLEAAARLAEFLARTGRTEEAAQWRADLAKRAAKAPPTFRQEARRWLAFAGG